MEKRKGSDFLIEWQPDYLAQEDQEQISQGLESFSSDSVVDTSEANDCKDLFNLGESGGSSDKNYGKSDTDSELKPNHRLVRKVLLGLFLNYCGLLDNQSYRPKKKLTLKVENQQKLRTQFRTYIEVLKVKKCFFEDNSSIPEKLLQLLDLIQDSWAEKVMCLVLPSKKTPKLDEKQLLGGLAKKSKDESWLHLLIAFYHEVSDFTEIRLKVWEEILLTVEFFRLTVGQSRNGYLFEATEEKKLIIRDISETVKNLHGAFPKIDTEHFLFPFDYESCLSKRTDSCIEPLLEDSRSCEESPPITKSSEPSSEKRNRLPEIKYLLDKEEIKEEEKRKKEERKITKEKLKEKYLIKTDNALAGRILTCMTKIFNLRDSKLKPANGAVSGNLHPLVDKDKLRGQQHIAGMLAVRKSALDQEVFPLNRLEVYIGLKFTYPRMLVLSKPESPGHGDLKDCCKLFKIGFLDSSLFEKQF